MHPSTLIIAEIGVNHNGSMKRAKEMVDCAAASGVDIAKFQTFCSEAIATRNAPKAKYQKQCSDQTESQFDMLKRLEFSLPQFQELQEYCKSKNIDFLSTAFDLDSVDLLVSLGLTLWKIPSGEITNLPYLRKIGSLGHELIVSTGMCTLDDIRQALTALNQAGTRYDQISLLHCNTQYPTPLVDVNLRVLQTLRTTFPELKGIGYSDHTDGTVIPTAAVALGASVIEKHFTLDRNLPGPDHRASLEPDALKEMVENIRAIEAALGSSTKGPTPSEMDNIQIARKSIVAATTIMKGEVFSNANLTVKRPGIGISPMNWDQLIGQSAQRDYKPDEQIDA